MKRYEKFVEENLHEEAIQENRQRDLHEEAIQENRQRDLKDLETLSVAYQDQLDKGKEPSDSKMKTLDAEISKLKKKLGV
tara:strand:- start:39 stop:278 length:240 start_codon:yes stop_codon:yes gene_type:complete